LHASALLFEAHNATITNKEQRNIERSITETAISIGATTSGTLIACIRCVESLTR
jgi:hypothetical protein